MAYSVAIPPQLAAQPIAGLRIWTYASTDVSTDVDAVGYFTNGYALGMRVGDTVHVIETDNSYAHTVHSVITSTAGGASTISAAT